MTSWLTKYHARQALSTSTSEASGPRAAAAIRHSESPGCTVTTPDCSVTADRSAGGVLVEGVPPVAAAAGPAAGAGVTGDPVGGSGASTVPVGTGSAAWDSGSNDGVAGVGWVGVAGAGAGWVGVAVSATL